MYYLLRQVSLYIILGKSMVCERAAQGRDDTGFNRDSGPGLCRSDSWGKCEPKTSTPHPLSQAEVAMVNGNAPGPSK